MSAAGHQAGCEPPVRKRDTQQSKLYRWEQDCIRPLDTRALTKGECTEAATVARAMYGLGPVPIDHREKDLKRATYDHIRKKIVLPPWGRNHSVVLHETTHSLLTYNDGHGPKFARVFLDLLARFMPQLPLGQIEAEARMRGLLIADACDAPSPLPLSKIRRLSAIREEITALEWRMAFNGEDRRAELLSLRNEESSIVGYASGDDNLGVAATLPKLP